MPKVQAKPLCPYFGVCGGCALQNVAYADQVEDKRQAIDDALAAAGFDIRLETIIPCHEPYYYRNRMDYPFGYQGELGLKAKGKWWKTLDLETCFLLSKETPEILCRAREWTKSSALPFWNVKTNQGFFRYLVIREGKNTGERMIMLVTSDQATLSDEQKKSFVALFDNMASSILIGVNASITDLSIPQTIETLKGNPYLTESVNEIIYRIQPASFFQTNTLMAAELQNTVLEFCGDVVDKRVMDLYCGAGFFSLALAKSATSVVGVELDVAAITAANVKPKLMESPMSVFWHQKPRNMTGSGTNQTW